MDRDGIISELTPEILLRVYASGIFPMAEDADDPTVFWVDPDLRGILPLDGLQVSKSLQRAVNQQRFDVRLDTAFDAVVTACAAPGPGRTETWINGEIQRLYSGLFDLGHAHSVECWKPGTPDNGGKDELVGGLYGVCLGGAFFGESMFSTATDASKVALCHLVARLRKGGYVLLDTQFVTDHLTSLGAVEITRDAYHLQLEQALLIDAKFYCGALDAGDAGDLAFRQSLTQTS
ncbi:MAG: leucyl/phenylalanyl-tRNA--protein transferase [Alphaproteobacteria bacterium]